MVLFQVYVSVSDIGQRKTRDIFYNCYEAIKWVNNWSSFDIKVQKPYKSILSQNDTGWILYRKILYHDFSICQFYTSLTGISDKISIQYLSISILPFQKLIQYFSILILPMFSISPMPDWHILRKMTVLSWHRYLLNSGIEKMSSI